MTLVKARTPQIIAGNQKPLFTGNDWDFDTIRRIHDACEAVAGPQLGLSWYPNQIEIITAEQMLDAYASIGMPLFYKHWSFGKHFAQHESRYRRGLMGPRLRDRHQLGPLHLLRHGGEHGDDADARHRARRLRPQPLLQEQLSVPAMDRR